jgi:predicted porin
MQSYGVINPSRYVSGGPSNRITNFLTGAHYKTGPVLWRASYSLGIDDNPYATDSLVVAGATIDLTKHVDLYVEYVNQQVDNNAAGNHVEFFDSINFIINWSF